MAVRDRLTHRGPLRDQVRMRSLAGPIAGKWMEALPSAAMNTIIADADFRGLCRWHLGLPLLSLDDPVQECPLCPSTVDPFGDHMVTCKKNGISRRHNALRDTFAALLSQLGLAYKKEVMAPDASRPADILLCAWDLGKDCAVDFTVTHPLAPSCLPLRLPDADRHCAEAEDRKRQGQKDACAAAGWCSAPSAFNP